MVEVLSVAPCRILNLAGGSLAPGSPADITVDPETNEVYVADGYLNRRVIVFDAETGAYRRHWGAYGERPDARHSGG